MPALGPDGIPRNSIRRKTEERLKRKCLMEDLGLDEAEFNF